MIFRNHIYPPISFVVDELCKEFRIGMKSDALNTDDNYQHNLQIKLINKFNKYYKNNKYPKDMTYPACLFKLVTYIDQYVQPNENKSNV